MIRIFSILDGYKVLKFQVNLNIFLKSGKNYRTQRRRLRYVPVIRLGVFRLDVFRVGVFRLGVFRLEDEVYKI